MPPPIISTPLLRFTFKMPTVAPTAVAAATPLPTVIFALVVASALIAACASASIVEAVTLTFTPLASVLPPRPAAAPLFSLSAVKPLLIVKVIALPSASFAAEESPSTFFLPEAPSASTVFFLSLATTLFWLVIAVSVCL